VCVVRGYIVSSLTYVFSQRRTWVMNEGLVSTQSVFTEWIEDGRKRQGQEERVSGLKLKALVCRTLILRTVLSQHESKNVK